MIWKDMKFAPKDGSYIIIRYGFDEAESVAWGICDRDRKMGWRPKYYEGDGSSEIESPLGWIDFPKDKEIKGDKRRENPKISYELKFDDGIRKIDDSVMREGVKPFKMSDLANQSVSDEYIIPDGFWKMIRSAQTKKELANCIITSHVDLNDHLAERADWLMENYLALSDEAWKMLFDLYPELENKQINLDLIRKKITIIGDK